MQLLCSQTLQKCGRFNTSARCIPGRYHYDAEPDHWRSGSECVTLTRDDVIRVLINLMPAGYVVTWKAVSIRQAVESEARSPIPDEFVYREAKFDMIV